MPVFRTLVLTGILHESDHWLGILCRDLALCIYARSALSYILTTWDMSMNSMKSVTKLSLNFRFAMDERWNLDDAASI